jgi:hypothetical protein
MRHEPRHIALGIGDSGDVPQGSVGVVLVTTEDLSLGLKLQKKVAIRVKTALLMGNGKPDASPWREEEGEGGSGLLHGESLVAAEKGPSRVLQECAGKKARLCQNLKSVADSENGKTFFGKGADGLHDGGSGRDDSCPKIVSVGEAARKNDGVKTFKRAFPVAHPTGKKSRNKGERLPGVEIAIGPRKSDDSDVKAVWHRESWR